MVGFAGLDRTRGCCIVTPVLTEWASVLVRWLHVIAAIGWIGSSFYFIRLDLSLKRHDGLPAGVKGEASQVHGGGFYHMLKYFVAPPRMPDELTWFKWEAYTTWLSGAALLVLVYYLAADLFLVQNIVVSRCSMCHSTEPVWDGFASAPKGVLLDGREEIVRRARLIETNAVRSPTMPPGNVTEMTDEERQALAAWLAADTPNR
jgi:uncharacterized membrane protein